MKQLFLILLVLLGFSAYGQGTVAPSGGVNEQEWNKGALKVDNGVYLTKKKPRFIHGDSTAVIWYDTTAKGVMLHIGTFAVQILSKRDTDFIQQYATGGGGGGGDVSSQALADSMGVVRDSLGDHWLAIQGRLKPADTAGKWIPVSTDVVTGARLDDSLNGYLGLTGGLYAMEAPVHTNSYPIIQPAPPTEGSHLTNKDYVDGLASGLRLTDLAKATTTEALPDYFYDINFPYTITMTSLGACPTFDGYAPHYNDLLLVKDETGADSIVNGPYRVKDAGSDTTYCTLARDSVNNTSFLLQHCAVPLDTFGVTNAGKIFVQTNPGVVLNERAIIFTFFSNGLYKAGDNVVINGRVINVTGVLKKEDSATGTGVLAAKYLTPYNFYQRLNAGIEVHGQWSWLDNLENQVVIVNSNTGVTAQNVSASTATVLRKDGKVEFDYPSGGGYLFPRNPTGFWNWNLRNRSGILTDSLELADTATAIRLTMSAIPQVDTTSLSNRINARVKYTDTVGMSNRIDARVKYADTVGMSNRIDARVKFTDTVGMSNRIDLRVKYTDTVTLSNRINLKVNYTDTVTLSNRINLKQNNSDTSTWDATRSWVQGQGFETSGTLLGTLIYSVAGTYTVTSSLPVGTRYIIVKGYGSGGGSAGCAGNGSGLAVSAGGSVGPPIEHKTGSWTSIVLTIGAGGSAGTFSGCPSCVATAGGNGGTSTYTDGFFTVTVPGGLGSAVVTGSNVNRSMPGGDIPAQASGANILNGYGKRGGRTTQFGNLVPNSSSGEGAAWEVVGSGGAPVNTVTTAANSGAGNASAAGGCMSGSLSGLSQSVNGGSGTPAYFILYCYK